MSQSNRFKRLEEKIDGFVSADQLQTLRENSWSAGSFDEFEMAMQKAQARGLHPMRKHVYPQTTYRREGTDRLELGIKIDGLRAIALRSDAYAGQNGPFWYDQKGQKHEIWLKESHPAAAVVEIHRHDHDYPSRGIARWDDYAPYTTNSDGEKKLQRMWDQKGPFMLAKCAEAAGIRKAFSVGLYIPEEVEKGKSEGQDESSSGGSSVVSSNVGGDGQKTELAHEQGEAGGLNAAFGNSTEGSSTDEATGSPQSSTVDEEQPQVESPTGNEEERGGKSAGGSEGESSQEKDPQGASQENDEAKPDRVIDAGLFGGQTENGSGRDEAPNPSSTTEDDTPRMEVTGEKGVSWKTDPVGGGEASAKQEGANKEKSGPDLSTLGDLTPEEEEKLHRHYQHVLKEVAEEMPPRDRVRQAGAELKGAEQSQYLGEEKREVTEQAVQERGIDPLPDDFPHRSLLISANLPTLQHVHDRLRERTLEEVQKMGEKRVENVREALGPIDFDPMPAA